MKLLCRISIVGCPANSGFIVSAGIFEELDDDDDDDDDEELCRSLLYETLFIEFEGWNNSVVNELWNSG